MSTKQSKKLSEKTRDKNSVAPNVYELIKSVPKQIEGYLPFIKNEDNILFAEYCLSFLESEFPDEIKNLKFDTEKDGLAMFIYEITNIALRHCNITSNESESSYDDNIIDADFFELHFIRYFNIPPHYYTIDIASMLKLNEPLRIGYSRILSSMAINAIHATNIDTAVFKPNQDFGENLTFEDYCEELEITPKKLNSLFVKWNKLLVQYQKYLNMDFKIFEDYKPKTKRLKELKELFSELIGLDGYDCFHKFPEHDDYIENGMNSYMELIIPVIDSQDVYGKYHLKNFESDINNNGISNPSTVISSGKDGIKKIHTKQDIDDFTRVCEITCEISFLINGEIPDNDF